MGRSLPSALGLALTAGLLLWPDAASAQTRSLCNPLNTQCPPNTALGMSINVDFRKGAVNSFAASGTPSYGDDGVSFAVARGGDAPQLNSLFYIMFGHVELTVKAAPGAGIVSSLVLDPTGGTIPSGWRMTAEGKIMRDSSASAAARASPPSPPLALLAALFAPLACRAALDLPGALW
ncbi:extracellular cell wall glucanase Crf1 [Ophiocordyceps sinensis CO18]|uniref:Extracellular cell wall glucanase Crf1 n=1 Tax=Ophiocordyceps sinensis (strain Co18 / CGMCC 3.14243) TaxID=911162 RepID=T5A2M6_OPHSC|nr:extracellular cell wall glucanase Crf1 [Ophiocordyceps sinensis CO18]